MKKIYFLTLALIITLLMPSVNADDFFADGKNIYSDHVYMVNTDTGKVVYELDSESIVYPASLTKVMTCILAIEHCSLDEVVTIPSGLFDDVYADGGANINLRYGEEITVGDLIKTTMIRSACDSASALGYHVSGSIEEFAKLMNAKAIEIGATNTHFVNAHGLHDDNHYTTAKDMYLIAEYALKNQTFCDIISQYTCTVPATNKSEERTVYTTIDIENPEKDNYYPYVTGVKSGYTGEAGRCLITKATKNGMSYLLVTLGANRDRYYNDNMAFTDAVTLFEYCFAQYSIKPILNGGEVLGEAAVQNGVEETVEVMARETVETLIALDDVPLVTLNYDPEIKAPIKSGEVLGNVTVEIGDEKYIKDIVAVSDVELKSDKVTLESFNNGDNVATYMDIVSIALIIISVTVLTVFLIKVLKKKK